jgi:alpha-galactosidase
VATRRIDWTPGRLRLTFTAGDGGPAGLTRFGALTIPPGAIRPLVEVLVAGDGRARAGTRFTDSGGGARLRYERHTEAAGRLEITQADPATGLRVTAVFEAGPDATAARVWTTVRNDGTGPVVLAAVSSFAAGLPASAGALLHSGVSDHLAENRWSARELWDQAGLAGTGPGRCAIAAVGTSTWSTAGTLPTGGLTDPAAGWSLAWQIEHNGGWRWEAGDAGPDTVAVVLLGPEEADHQWAEELAPGAAFTTVGVSVAAAAGDFPAAIAELTAHRRWLRRRRPAGPAPLLVFNDYMNTLNGDPSTDRLLPLIDAAARAGAECFCIDAGWYDDTERGDWWPGVGEWIPSARRFPGGGLARVIAAIRDAGLVPGLWLEPEVAGVRSPVAGALPGAAFLRRHGRRVREQDRYFLDLRHPAAREHLDRTVDRLVAEFGIGYFKLDYNVTPGPGTDVDAYSVGAGLLAAGRAHLDWFAALRRRHPRVTFENCASGAMRADFAMLELFDLQSTSDQEDFRRYPPIAAGAPVQMLPEQAGNWAYPQAWMSDEEIAYTMVTGLSGRLYLSGFLDRMTPAQLALVQDAAALHKQIRADIAQSVPGWPLGLPQWYGDAVALTLTAAGRTLLYAWHRGGAAGELRLRLGSGAHRLEELYPRRLAAWEVTDGPDATVVLRPGRAGPSARVYQVAHGHLSPHPAARENR